MIAEPREPVPYDVIYRTSHVGVGNQRAERVGPVRGCRRLESTV